MDDFMENKLSEVAKDADSEELEQIFESRGSEIGEKIRSSVPIEQIAQEMDTNGIEKEGLVSNLKELKNSYIEKTDAEKSEGTIPIGSLITEEKALAELRVNSLMEHTAVVGRTGSGKSVGTGILCEGLQRIKYGGSDEPLRFPVFIVDHHGEYRSLVAEESGEDGYPGKIFYLPDVYEEEGSNSPFGIDLSDENLRLNDYGDINPYLTSELQKGLVQRAISDAAERPSSAKGFKNIVEDIVPNYDPHHSTMEAIRRHFGTFVDNHSGVFVDRQHPEFELDVLTRRGGIYVIDLGSSKLNIISYQILVGYLCQVLYNYFKTHPERVGLLVIDEAQNYVPDTSEIEVGIPNYSLARIKRIFSEGRKFGLGVWLVSQRPRYIANTPLSQCNSHIMFGLGAEDIRYVKRVLGEEISREELSRIQAFGRGQACVYGRVLPVKFPLYVQFNINLRRTEHRSLAVDPLEEISKLQTESSISETEVDYVD